MFGVICDKCGKRIPIPFNKLSNISEDALYDWIYQDLGWITVDTKDICEKCKIGITLNICKVCGSDKSNYQWQQFKDGNKHIRESCASCGEYKNYVPLTKENISKINVEGIYKK